MKTKINTLMRVVATCFTTILMSSATGQPVSWTSSFDASHQMTLDNTTTVISLQYNPVNGDVYAFGQTYFYLPGNPGLAQTREFGVVRFNHTTGTQTGEVFPHHFTPTQTVPYFDIPGEMVVAADGNVYVTGSYLYDNVSGYDMVVIKYDINLTEQWRHYFRGAGLSSDIGTSIAMDAAGNVCVAGQISDNGTSTGADALIAKLNSSGTVLWQQILTSSGEEMDYPTDIIADNTGNVYATGYAGSTTSGKQYAVVKISSMGTVQWKRKFNQVPSSALDDIANSVAVDNASGNVYITGTSYNSSGNSDIITICYNASGTRLWVRQINNPGDSRDRGVKVMVDADRNIFVGGDVDKDPSALSNGDNIIRKYRPNGSVIGTVLFNGSGYNCDFGDFQVTSTGSVYMISSCVGAVPAPSSYASSMMTTKFNSLGAVQWNDLLSPPQFLSCGEGYFGRKIAVNVASAEACSGGRYFRDCPGANTETWQLRNYTPTSRLANEFPAMQPPDLKIKLYPNPFREVMYFDMSETNLEIYDVSIFDPSGRRIDSFRSTGGLYRYDASQLPEGVYLVTITGQSQHVMIKVVKMNQ